MSFEETLTAALDARLTPQLAQVERLTAEVVQLRRALPPQLVSMEQAGQMLGVSLPACAVGSATGPFQCAELAGRCA